MDARSSRPVDRTLTAQPLPFDPARGMAQPDEAQTVADMRAATRPIVESTSRDSTP